MNIPNAKFQMPKELQILKPEKRQEGAGSSFAIWFLGFFWRLKFGVWNFATLS
jgi:hypothetical protein